METEIDRLRRDIRIHGKDFTANDFNVYTHVHSLVRNLEKMGEIRCIGLAEKSTCGRRAKIYRAVNVKVESGRKPRPAIRKRKYESANLWASVYPELFTVPDFTGYRVSVRYNSLMI